MHTCSQTHTSLPFACTASTITPSGTIYLPRPIVPAPLPSPLLRRGPPCLPWLHSWLTGTALLDGRGNEQAKQEWSTAAFLCYLDLKPPVPTHHPALYGFFLKLFFKILIILFPLTPNTQCQSFSLVCFSVSVDSCVFCLVVLHLV